MPAHTKREDELQRPRSRKGGDAGKAATRLDLLPVSIPRADPNWHPMALRIWNGLKTSGQRELLQNSDWALAFSLLDDLTHYKNSQRRSPEMLKAILGGLEKLMLTETDRRKIRVELHAPQVEERGADLVAIDGYRAALAAGGA